MNASKPTPPKGMSCPLWRKDVSKVCPTCEMFEPLPKKVVHLDGTEHLAPAEWGCTLKHQTTVLRDLGYALLGQQAAAESFRNTSWKESQQNLVAMIAAAQEHQKQNQAAMRAVAEAVAGLAGAVDRLDMLAPPDRARALSSPSKEN